MYTIKCMHSSIKKSSKAMIKLPNKDLQWNLSNRTLQERDTVLNISLQWIKLNPHNWNLLKEDNLYTGDKPLEFILVPKCPLFGDSTVLTNIYQTLPIRKEISLKWLIFESSEQLPRSNYMCCYH